MEAYEATPPMVECENLVKIYKTKDIEVLALQGLEVRIDKGELMAIIGNSGSGKSTFLNMIGGLDRPSAGHLIVDGKNLFKLSDRELVDYKRRTVGFVWQNNARNLVPYLTAWQNVQMPMLFDKGAKKKQRALELLEMVGLAHKKNSRLHNSPAASNSASPWPLPCPTGPNFCWRMSRPARWTPRPAHTFSICCGPSIAIPA